MDISHAGVTVASLAESLRFYRDLLGMEVVREYASEGEIGRLMWNAPGLTRLDNVMLRLPGTSPELQLTEPFGEYGERRSHLRAEPWDDGAVAIVVQVPDVAAQVARFEAAGYASRGVVHAPGGRVGALVTDPNGFFVELAVRPVREDAPLHARVTVHGLDRSLWFYRDVLGMEVLAEWQEDPVFRRELWAAPADTAARSVLLRLPGSSQLIQLVEVDGPVAGQVLSHQWDAGYAHVSFAVEDLAGLVAQLATRDIEPRALVWGRLPIWVGGSIVPDPDGFNLELLELL